MSEPTPRPARKPRTRRAKPETAAVDGPAPGPAVELEPLSPPAAQPAAAADQPPPGAGAEQPPLGPAAEPTPLDVPLEEQITSLPPLEFPGNPNDDFTQWAAVKRRRRIRVEIYGGAFLILVGVVASVVTGHSAFIVISLFAVVGLAAYEFLVTSFE
jgi:hypothetical protein